MGQFYTVSNSMRAKDRDGNPKVWESQYGTFDIWNVYFEGDDTKYQVNKKEGFGGYTKGQQVYGTTTQSQYGGRFKQEQAPDGVVPQGAPRQSAPVTAGGSSVDSKLDYIISLLENRPNFQGNGQGAGKSGDVIPEDIDEGGPSLEDLDY